MLGAQRKMYNITTLNIEMFLNWGCNDSRNDNPNVYLMPAEIRVYKSIVLTDCHRSRIPKNM